MKLNRSFYQGSAEAIAPRFLGKELVFRSSHGIIAGQIAEVEAYPAFTDKVSHGNKRTARTEVMYGPPGYLYIYLIYGLYYQSAIVVNKKEIPEVVFIRAVKPTQGLKLMQTNYGKKIDDVGLLTNSPGKLCKAFGIDLDLYGQDITKDLIYLEDKGVKINRSQIVNEARVGINKNLEGSSAKLRWRLV